MEAIEMEKKLNDHDHVIHENILPRLKNVEDAQLTYEQRMAQMTNDLLSVQKGQKELELTVMRDGKETRDLLKPFADHVLKQVEFEAQTEKDIAIKKMDAREKILTGIFGAGGLAGIIAAIVTFIK